MERTNDAESSFSGRYGDSVTSDVRGAQSAGVRPILLDRGRKNAAGGYLTAASLTEVLPYLRGDIPMGSS